MLSVRRPSRLGARLALVAAILLAGDYALTATHAQETAQAGNSANKHTASAQALYWPGNFAVAQVAATMGAQSTWNVANPEKGNGYAVLGYHNGPTSNQACPTTPSSYAYATSAANGATTVTDTTSAYAAGTNATYEGSYSCFAIQQWYVPGVAQTSWTASTSPAWTSTNNPATTLPSGTYTTSGTFPNGMFVTSFTLTDTNATAGTVDAGDQLVINYTYSTNAPSLSTLSLCTSVSTQTIFIGQKLTGSTCDTAGGTSVGTLTGGTFTSNKSNDGVYALLSAAWSNSNKTLTITIGALSAGKQAATMSTGPWTFTPSQSPETAQVLVTQQGGHKVCKATNTSSAHCLQTYTGVF
jgi:hypothetical protein